MDTSPMQQRRQLTQDPLRPSMAAQGHMLAASSTHTLRLQRHLLSSLRLSPSRRAITDNCTDRRRLTILTPTTPPRKVVPTMSPSIQS